MMRRTPSSSVGNINRRDRAHSAFGASPSAQSKGSASCQIRPLATAIVITTANYNGDNAQISYQIAVISNQLPVIGSHLPFASMRFALAHI
ncbi:MAG: hypothetical protein ACR2P4_03025 [Gammaproteobacteria bacterium]